MKHYLWPILLILPMLVQANRPLERTAQGRFIKDALERYHLSRSRFDDKLSQRAFHLFIESLDSSKNYFLQSDIQELEQYLTNIDDQIVSGDYRLLDRAFSIIKKRIAQAERLGEEFFAGGFDFTRDEGLETDLEKRQYPKDAAEFRERWRKLFKFSVLNRYVDLVAAEEGATGDEKQLMEKAYKQAFENYKNVFRKSHEQNYAGYLETFYDSVAKSFGPHSAYFSPFFTRKIVAEAFNSLKGIGIEFSKKNVYPEVVDVTIGGPAWKQGELEPGDLLLSIVDQKGKTVSFLDKNYEDITSLIRGKSGSTAVLTIKKLDGTIKTVSIVRASTTMTQNKISSFVLEHEDMKDRVGYMILPSFFYKGSAQDVLLEIKRLRSKNISGLILDLRGSRGGSLDDVAQMVGLFIETGPIVQTYDLKRRVMRTDNDPRIGYKGPLVLMIDGRSVSGAEIFVGALQDYKRGVVVGQNSFGKGTIQGLLRKKNSGEEEIESVKVTTGAFYRITGVPYQHLGVTPDVVLPNPNPGFRVSERTLDYSPAVDPISSAEYVTPWDYYNISQLQEYSHQRVENSKYFQNMARLERALEHVSGETYISLNRDKAVEKKTRDRERSGVYSDVVAKLENGLIVSVDKEGILGILGEQTEEISEYEEKWERVFQKRKKNWVKKIHRDFLLEESMHIMKDILEGMDPGSKKSMR